MPGPQPGTRLPASPDRRVSAVRHMRKVYSRSADRGRRLATAGPGYTADLGFAEDPVTPDPGFAETPNLCR